MSQNVSTNPKERESSIASTPIQPWSAEAEADRLMDELFSDIDEVLEGSSRLPTEPVKPEYVSLKSIVIPQIAAPPAVIAPQELVEQPTPEPIEDSKPSETTETKEAPSDNSRAKRSGRSLEKLLLITGLASLAIAIALLLSSQKKLKWPWSLKGSISPAVHRSAVSASDAQFSNYMLRSLEVIDNKVKARQLASVPPGGTGTANASSIPVPSNRTLAPNQPQRVLERVYIPVYPPQSPVAPSALPSVARPPVSALPVAPPSVARPSASSPASRRSGSNPSPAARRSAPNPSSPARATVPAPPQAAAPVDIPALPPPAPPAVSVPPAPLTQSPVSDKKYTFAGVEEQSNQPVAWFQVGDAIQRVYVGEGIGDSGWTLVSVTNQEAVIRRNGEVRSVYAGRSF